MHVRGEEHLSHLAVGSQQRRHLLLGPDQRASTGWSPKVFGSESGLPHDRSFLVIRALFSEKKISQDNQTHSKTTNFHVVGAKVPID